MSDKAISRMYYLCSVGQIVAATFFGLAEQWLPCAIFVGLAVGHAFVGFAWQRVANAEAKSEG